MKKTALPAEIAAQIDAAVARVTLKNIKTRRTLDGGAMKADFYFDGHLVDTFDDPGEGGGAYPLSFNSQGGQAFIAFFNDSNIRDLMAAEWTFIKRDEITPSQLADWLVSKAFNLEMAKKKAKSADAAIARAHKDKLTWLNENDETISLRFKGIRNMTMLVGLPNGRATLQKEYNTISVRLSAAKKHFLTPASVLTKLGIQINPALHPNT